MTRMITLTEKAKKAEAKGQKAKVIETLSKLGASKKGVEFKALAKAVGRTIADQKRLRAHVRNLVEEKIAHVKVVKAEKKAA